MIDLETGQFFTPPPRLEEKAEECLRWIRDRGIDAYAFFGVTNSLIGYDLASQTVDASTWDIAAPQTTGGLLEGRKAGVMSYLTTTNPCRGASKTGQVL